MERVFLPPSARIILLCVASLTIMVGAVIAPGVMSIATHLNVSLHPGWLITLPALGAILLAPIGGKLIDHIGAYRCLVLSLFLYGLIGGMVIYLRHPILVYADRLMLGGITALVMASCTVLISQWFQGQSRLKMIAKQGMAIELGGVLFLFLGGHLASLYWALPLTIYLMAWVFLGLVIRYVPSKSPSSTDNQALELAETIHDDGFSLTAVYVMTLLAMTVFFSLIVILPVTLGQQGIDEVHIGYLLAFISLIAVLSAFFMPTIVRRLGELPTLTLAFFLFTLAHCFFYFASASDMLIIASIFSGAGFGLSIPLLNHMTVQRSPSRDMGRHLSFYTMAVFSGQFLISFIELLPHYQTHAYLLAAVIACFTVIALLRSQWFIKKMHSKQL